MSGIGGWAAFYWGCAAAVVYPYLVYPAWLWARSRWRPDPVRRSGAGVRRPSVSVVIAAYNEEATIGRRIEEFLGKIESAGLTGEILVVSDGSTDGTTVVARSFAGGAVPVSVIARGDNVGKAAALSAGCLAARHEVVVLADARQVWGEDALIRLLENFEDPRVGAVGGELFVESGAGVMSGVGLYWKYEKALRRMESLIHSTVGLTGAICAVRRGLFRVVPRGTVLDDVYWPLRVVMGGHRVVFDGRAHAFDRLPEEVGSEFRRKVRTLAGNFQLACELPACLVPGRNPIWFAMWSHKLARLAVPWALIGAALAAGVIGGPVYGTLLGLELAGVGLGVLGIWTRVGARSRLCAAGASFLVLNAAAAMGLFVWATGRTARSWTKTAYRPVQAARADAIGVGR